VVSDKWFADGVPDRRRIAIFAVWVKGGFSIATTVIGLHDTTDVQHVILEAGRNWTFLFTCTVLLKQDNQKRYNDESQNLIPLVTKDFRPPF